MAISEKNKTLTIGIPVYNGSKYIEKRIIEIQNAVKCDYRIIISDNFSDDKTQEICKKFLSNKNITYYRQNRNIGVIENFKFLINMCKTKYFVFASVDDVWDLNFIDDNIKLLKENKAAVAFSNFYISDKKTKKKIPIYVTPSVSNSSFVRLLTRVIDPVPHIIYGVIDLDFYKNDMLKNMDFFDIYFTFALSLSGKVIVSNKFSYEWQVDGYRKSYSIISKEVSGLKFFFNTLGLVKKFSLLKKLFLIILLFRWTIINLFKRKFSPNYYDVKF